MSATLAARAKTETDEITNLAAPIGDATQLLEAARLVLEDESGRKVGAETRATTFLATVATLIPLLTWAVGNSTPACSPGLGCSVWSAVFILAVFYLLLAGLWSLRALSVENYHCLGVEDIRKFSAEADFALAVAKETLIAARLNRDTINRKLTFIKVAQRCFFQALVLLAFLLMFDPIARYHQLWDNAPIEKKTEITACVPPQPLAGPEPLLPATTLPPAVAPATVKPQEVHPAKPDVSKGSP